MATQEYKPPIFFAVAFVILLIGLFSKFAFKGQSPVTPQMRVQEKRDETSERIVRSIKRLDMNKPVSCLFDDNTSTVSARMEGVNIRVDIAARKGSAQHVLVAGDCMYSWSDDKSNAGMKKCGMGTYISMGKQFLGSGLLSSEMVEEGIKEVGKSMQFDLVRAIDSCKNTNASDAGTFAIPRGIRFVDEASPASK